MWKLLALVVFFVPLSYGQISGRISHRDVESWRSRFSVSKAVRSASKAHVDMVKSYRNGAQELPCDGGGRTWAKLVRLNGTMKEDTDRIRDRINAIGPSCASIPYTDGGNTDPSGMELVVPQRIFRSQALSDLQKSQCLQAWIDWYALDKIHALIGREIIENFESRCLSPPNPSGSPPATNR
jgi:hypothetical protein